MGTTCYLYTRFKAEAGGIIKKFTYGAPLKVLLMLAEVTSAYIALALLSFALFVLALRGRFRVVVPLSILVLVAVFAYYSMNSAIIEGRGDVKFYEASARAFVSGSNPYTGEYPCNYGPVMLLLFAPLVWVRPLVLLTAYYVVLLCLILATLRGKDLGLAEASTLLLAAAVNPLLHYNAVGLAQLDDLASALLVVLIALFSGSPVISGALVGLAASAKIYLGALLLPLLISEARSRNWRRLWIVLTTAAAMFILVNVSAFVAYGWSFIEEAYLTHTERSEGLSIAATLYMLGIRSEAIAWLISALLLVILLTLSARSWSSLDEGFAKTLSAVFASMPLLFPEYLAALSPLIYISAAENRDREFVALFTALTVSARLWQHFVQSQPSPSIAAQLILSPLTVLLLALIKYSKI